MRDYKAVTQINNAVRGKYRQMILELVKNNPGLNVTQIQIAIRKQSHSEASVELGVLRRANLIRSEKIGKQRLYYFNHDKEPMLEELNAIAEKIIKK